MDQSRYESRGVSSDKNEVHKAIQKLDQGLFKHSFCKVLPDPFSLDPDNCMILHADTAGSKTILAYLYWKETGDISVWNGIAQDALVMNLDDMACSGAIDQFVISNTILRNKKLIPGEVLESIIDGTIAFIENMKKYGVHIHHAGGETADVGDVVRTIDVGYTAYTQINRSKVFDNHIQAGDQILGIGSFGKASYESDYNSGIGCNGLTSARHDVLNKYYAETFPESYDDSIEKNLVYSGKYRINDIVQENSLTHQVGKLLLSPTRTYLPLLQKLFTNKIDSGIHGIIHCTGGAHSKVLKFVDGVKIIKDNLPTPPAIFNIIQDCSGASLYELYKVLNMGIRLEIYGSESALSKVKMYADELDLPNQIIGRVEKSDDFNSSVIMKVNGEAWTY